MVDILLEEKTIDVKREGIGIEEIEVAEKTEISDDIVITNLTTLTSKRVEATQMNLKMMKVSDGMASSGYNVPATLLTLWLIMSTVKWRR